MDDDDPFESAMWESFRRYVYQRGRGLEPRTPVFSNGAELCTADGKTVPVQWGRNYPVTVREKMFAARRRTLQLLKGGKHDTDAAK